VGFIADIAEFSFEYTQPEIPLLMRESGTPVASHARASNDEH
jgi:hypothetical protein